jgi:excisionase family DNA binding protein
MWTTTAFLRGPAMRARMTPKEVGHRLNVGTRAVYDMLEQGILPGIRPGRYWLR